MKLDHDTLSRSEEVAAALTSHIEKFLEILEATELEIIKPHIDIVSGQYGYSLLRYGLNFHNISQGKIIRTRKKKFVFKVDSHDGDGVLVVYDGSKIKIPYKCTEESTKRYCSDFFHKLINDIKLGKMDKAEYLRKRAVENATEESIRAEHQSGRCSYSWQDCPDCYDKWSKSSSGRVRVGTGQYEWSDWSFDRDGEPRKVEVIKLVNCPTCHGTGGLLVFCDGGWERKRACGKTDFKRFEHDFDKMMREIGND